MSNFKRRFNRGGSRRERGKLYTLGWSKSEYVPLEPGDLLPSPPPTIEQRARVAAALLTRMRDEHMCDIGDLPPGYVTAFDAEDPKVRFEQTVRHLGN